MRKERGTSLVGPVVKNPPPNAGGTALIPGRGTKIPYTAGQLQNLHHNERSCIPRRRSRGPQLRTSAANKQISILKEKKKKKGEEYLRHRAEMAV